MSISNGKFQGVTRYYELNEKMMAAHRRVVAGMGGPGVSGDGVG